jgi:hypothetical protein
MVGHQVFVVIVWTIVLLKMRDMPKPEEETFVILPEELHPDQEVDVSYGVCINPKCKMGHGTVVMGYVFQGELANGYCIDCWDAGHGFKPGEPTAGYTRTFKRDAQGYYG